MTGKISNLPAIISMESTILEKPEYAAKLQVGPTKENPGPTLLIQVSDAEKWVVKSEVKPFARVKSFQDIKRVQRRSKATYVQKKVCTECTIASVIGLPFSRTVSTLRGLIILRTSRKVPFARVLIREILTPPAVDPAHAPVIIMKISTTLEREGHKS